MKWSWTINLRRFFQVSVMLRCSCPFWSNPRPGAALGDPEDNVFIVSLARRPEKRARVFRQLEEHQLSLTDKSRGHGLLGWRTRCKGNPADWVTMFHSGSDDHVCFCRFGVFKRHTSLMLMMLMLIV